MADGDPHPSWQALLGGELGGSAMAALRAAVAAERGAGLDVFPAARDELRALALTPVDTLRAVILGQDPYHGAGQAHGLAFSVPPEVAVPPSLANIYKELAADLGIAPAQHGCLDRWAAQGVLLLNSVLTVRAGEAGSHRGLGWEAFTDAVIRAAATHAPPSAFVLWGAAAGRKAALIAAADPRGRHLVLTAPHPSPLSAYRGFFGSRPFSQVNAFLVARGREPIDWELP